MGASIRRLAVNFVVIVAAGTSLLVSGPTAAAPTIAKIDFPASPRTEAFGINNHRMVVGWFAEMDETGQVGTDQAFARLNRFVVKLDIPGRSATALGLNDHGEIVGFRDDGVGQGEGFKYSNGTFVPVRVPDSVHTTPRAINNRGDIVGHFGDARWRGHAFLLSGGQFTVLEPPESRGGPARAQGINDLGDIVGFYEPGGTSAVTDGFLLSNGRYTTIRVPGAMRTFPFGINNDGVIVGFYSDSAYREHGFIFRGGRFTTVDLPDRLATRIYAINDTGDFVGVYTPGVSYFSFRSHLRDW
jgi:uncharacterized membrane protein